LSPDYFLSTSQGCTVKVERSEPGGRERYFQIESDDVRMFYVKSSGTEKHPKELKDVCTTFAPLSGVKNFD
jgi:hypothetical protein